jgi:putative SOS response-associated peptidase YedK
MQMTPEQLARLLRQCSPPVVVDEPLLFTVPALPLAIRPTTTVPVLKRSTRAGLAAADARWGFAGHDGRALINARGETVARLPTFRDAFAGRQGERCLVVASSYFEWQAIEGASRKRKWSIERADGQPLLMAGLLRGGACVIITAAAGPALASIHDRTPALIEPASVPAWLNPATPEQQAQALVSPVPEGRLVAQPAEPAPPVTGSLFD